MKILFMDDNQQRCDTFAAMVDGSGARADIATTHTAAMEMLSNFKYDAVFLDHDLDGMHYADSDLPNTGYQVAKFITGLDYDKRPGEIVIHSWNPAGTAKMFLQLSMYPPTIAAFGTRGFLAVVKDLVK